MAISNVMQLSSEKIKEGDKFISRHIFEPSFQEVLKEHWLNSKDIKTDKFEIISKPFRICRINNFLQSPLGTYDLRGEVLSVHTRRRGTDLMQLHESIVDLTKVTPESSYSQNVECIRQFCSELIIDLKPWMMNNTKIHLNDKLSIRGSSYSDTDFLLCHNDKVEDRKIAFILYLSKDWKPEYGGSLDVFDSNENGIPSNVAHSLYPTFNSFVFFEVSNISYHQVREVIGSIARHSVNGWFHAEIVENDLPLRLEKPLAFVDPKPIEADLSVWIRENRLINDTFIKLINKTIELFSFCGIKHYLNEEVYRQLSEEVTSEKIRWTRLGPPDERNYEVADEDSLPNNLKQFYNAIESVSFCRLLHRYSELDLIPSEKSKPKLVIELQRWSEGCYTVLHDGQLNKRYRTDDMEEDDDENESSDACIVEEGPSCTINRSTKITENKNKEYSLKEMMEDIIGEASDSSEVTSSILSNINSPRSNEGLQDIGKKDIINYDNDVNVESILEQNEENKKKRSCEYGDNKQTKKTKIRNDSLDKKSETDSETEPGSGTLDVVLYFNANHAPENTTLTYVDPEKEDGVCLTLPISNNSLFIVYRQEGILRYHEYVNHNCKKYFYSLVCSFRE